MVRRQAFFATLFVSLTGWAATQAGGPCVKSGCHETLLAGRSVHSAAQDDCGACHEATDAKTHHFKLTAEEKELCGTCHDPGELLRGKSVHPPAETGCLSCHSPHASPRAHLIREEQLCFQCHEKTAGDHGHGPYEAQACGACHAPHASAQPKLLRAGGPELCVQCHAEVREALSSSAQAHPPAQEGCTECHAPHAAQNAALLRQPPSDLCRGCHSDILVESPAPATVHSPVRDGQACLGCHLPHGGPEKKLLTARMNTLCLSCHQTPRTKDNHAVRAIQMQPETSLGKHPPVEESCAGCHRPHTSGLPLLLTQSFPARMYVPFSTAAYQLCFDCHDPVAFETPQTVNDTRFRDGNRNLHFLHVNKDRKGRNCVFCHDVHGSASAHLIRESASFGSWAIPLKYAATADGGSCAAGCHAAKTYKNATAP
jgi:predicted CXXCH cytochrome family protein